MHSSRNFLHLAWTLVGLGVLSGEPAAAREGSAREPGSVADAVLAEDRFGSVEAAVVAAVARVGQRSKREDREYMGAVLAMPEGAFRYSVAPGRAGHDRVSVRIRVPDGARLVALWHTHGASHSSRDYFSPVDTALANERNLPFYLARPSGELRVYSPGDPTLSAREARQLGLGPTRGVARGKLASSAREAAPALVSRAGVAGERG